jgi:hypothetical protein
MRVTATMQMTQSVNSMRLFIRIFKRLVWCRHSHMSRPFTVDDEPYRLCLQCGARRRFDKYSWTKLHPYYL